MVLYPVHHLILKIVFKKMGRVRGGREPNTRAPYPGCRMLSGVHGYQTPQHPGVNPVGTGHALSAPHREWSETIPAHPREWLDGIPPEPGAGNFLQILMVYFSRLVSVKSQAHRL